MYAYQIVHQPGQLIRDLLPKMHCMSICILYSMAHTYSLTGYSKASNNNERNKKKHREREREGEKNHSFIHQMSNN